MKILGIGVDIVENLRIKRLTKKNMDPIKENLFQVKLDYLLTSFCQKILKI